ncbi:anti-sigma factor domain-containing protein [Microbacterium cremeum]|uniref:anti-sigma factor domain-containing protein n=1 Tax=Microbacterium cremeum TaxID=2782169 RepID=UPI001E2A9C4F|nr:anti-sigma factor [Microbacterium cremeum]
MVIDGLDIPDDGTTRIDRVGVLLARTAEGDESAFARLYDLLAPRVFGLALATVGDRAQSEQVLQDVFLEVWRAAARFASSGERGRPWVLAIAQRRAADAARGRAGDGQPSSSTDAATTAVATADAAPPLTMRSSLLAQIAASPQVPPVEASVVAAALEQGEAVAMPQRAAPDRTDHPMVEPAPTTTVIQAMSRRNWTRAVVGLAVALVVLVGLGYVAATINEVLTRPPTLAALDEIEAAPDAVSATVALDDGGSATAHWSPSLGEAVLVTTDLRAIGANEVLEIWWVQDGQYTPAGTFDPGPDGSATVQLEGDWQEGAVIAVTVAPEDAPAEGTPTERPIFEIPTG